MTGVADEVVVGGLIDVDQPGELHVLIAAGAGVVEIAPAPVAAGHVKAGVSAGVQKRVALAVDVAPVGESRCDSRPDPDTRGRRPL
jgi:hypothetical protein